MSDRACHSTRRRTPLRSGLLTKQKCYSAKTNGTKRTFRPWPENLLKARPTQMERTRVSRRSTNYSTFGFVLRPIQQLWRSSAFGQGQNSRSRHPCGLIYKTM